MTRSQPRRVNTASCIAISCRCRRRAGRRSRNTRPRCSRARRRSRCRPARGPSAASSTPASSRTGRRLMYCWKLPADRDQQPPQRDVVGHAGIADRAEKDRVERAQLVEPVLRHHPAGLARRSRSSSRIRAIRARSRSAAPPLPAPRCLPARPRVPMPSPAITATRYLFAIAVSSVLAHLSKPGARDLGCQ